MGDGGSAGGAGGGGSAGGTGGSAGGDGGSRAQISQPLLVVDPSLVHNIAEATSMPSGGGLPEPYEYPDVKRIAYEYEYESS